MHGLVNSHICPGMSIEQIDDPQVRELIESYVSDGGYGAPQSPWPASELVLPWYARGQCANAAEALSSFARTHGFKAWRPKGYRSSSECDDHGYPLTASEPVQLTPETFGHTDRLNQGYPTHFWTCIEHAGRIWGVDMTASQYGYAGPVVRVCDASCPELWAQRMIWHLQLPPALDITDIVCNRSDAGLAANTHNPSMVQVWNHPDGAARFVRSYAIDCAEQLRTELAPDPDLMIEANPGWGDEVAQRLASRAT